VEVDVGDEHDGAGLVQATGDALADADGAACDDRGAAREVDQLTRRGEGGRCDIGAHPKTIPSPPSADIRPIPRGLAENY